MSAAQDIESLSAKFGADVVGTKEFRGEHTISVKLGVLHTKVLCVILFIMLIRWTIPRFRFDQLMNLAWKVLIPLALGNVVAVMCIKQFGLSMWWATIANLLLFILAGIIGTLSSQKAMERGVGRLPAAA